MKKTLFIAHYEGENPYAVEQRLSLTENGENEISVIVVNVPNKAYIRSGLKQLVEKVHGDSRQKLLYLLGLLGNSGIKMAAPKALIKTIALELKFQWLKPEHVIYVMG